VRDALTGALIDQANGAQPGEYISIYLTGVGTVTPTIADGAVPSPSGTPVNNSDEFNFGNLNVYFNDYNSGSVGNPGTVQFAGLVPGLAGLYQINVQIPTSGLTSGDDVEIEILTDTADVNQIYIPFGTGAPPPLAKPATAQSRLAHAAAIRSAREHMHMKRRAARGSATGEPPKQ
jgi:uncharacterized protein (TIGR03437 family)